MTSPRAWKSRPFDVVLLLFLTWFLLGWLSSDLPLLLGVASDGVATYVAQIDPFMANPTPAAELTLALAAVLYGPAYAAMFYAIFRERSWASALVLPMSGMIVGTTLVYMYASISSPTPPLHLPAFLCLNGAYVLGPVLMIARYARHSGGTGDTGHPPVGVACSAGPAPRV